MSRKQIPVACSLTASAADRQLSEWHELQGRAVDVTTVDGGVAMTFPASLEDDIRDLALREASCCSFLDISVADGEQTNTISVSITSTQTDAMPVIEALSGLGSR